MKIDFKPQRLNNVLALEETVKNGVRRILKTPDGKTVDMVLSNVDSLGNVYPKEYYVSSLKLYGKNSMLIKSIDREVTDTANSVTTLKKGYNTLSGVVNYKTYKIVRNNDKITKTELKK